MNDLRTKRRASSREFFDECIKGTSRLDVMVIEKRNRNITALM